MNSISILYISTNGMWSGSEELWTRSARSLSSSGYEVAYATKFEYSALDKIQGIGFNYASRYLKKPIAKRLIERLLRLKFSKDDVLKNLILKFKPKLIVISQGNSYESLDIIELCVELKVPYVTITQLVSELFIFMVQNESILSAQQAYLGAVKNFFVSDNNLKLNNFLLGCDLPNAEIAYNPCKLTIDQVPEYPHGSPIYTIGLVGRLECWHKGYDILIQVLKEVKWKSRPVQFNIYGEGPHSTFINSYIDKWNIKNVSLKGHSSEVNQIWAENQILLMPSRHEGQALALIEAMWCQRAAIVTNVGGASELIEENISGFIADRPSIESVDQALERAWAQRHNWKQMGLNASISLKNKYPADAIDYFNKRIVSCINI